MNNENRVQVITIDGPSGTGKGTICHLLAKALDWNLLDSGVIYRVLAFAATEKGLDLSHIQPLVALANHLDLEFKITEDSQQVILNGSDVSALIRSEACGQNASTIAAYPEVRKALLDRQRAFAKSPGLVTDGRDMGTVVFPDADIKLFLFASEEERAKRRHLQLNNRGNHVSLAQVVTELAQRDAKDTKRACAPLKAAEDAIKIDTTGINVAQVFDYVLKLVKERLK